MTRVSISTRSIPRNISCERLGNDTLLYVGSMVPIGLTLLLHTLHMFLAPMLISLGGAELHASQSEMDMDMSTGMAMHMDHGASGTLFTLTIFLLNFAGIIYGCWLLWHSWKKPAKGRLALLRPIISGSSVAAGILLFVWMQ